MKCKKCGNIVSGKEAFCGHCGMKIQKPKLWLILVIVFLSLAVITASFAFICHIIQSKNNNDTDESIVSTIEEQSEDLQDTKEAAAGTEEIATHPEKPTTDPEETTTGPEEITTQPEENSVVRVYSQTDAQPQLYIYAENTRIPEEESEVILHIRIPKKCELSTLNICRADGEVMYTFEPAYLEPVDESVEIGAHLYYDYSAAIRIPAVENDETAVGLFVQMGEEQSNTLLLYREIVVTDEMLETLCDVMDNIVDRADSIEKTGTSQLLDELLTCLEGDNKVLHAWQENETTLRFVTVDGLSGAFTATRVYEDENLYAGSGVTSDMDELNSIFEYDKSFRSVTLDPDVLLMCPVRGVYSDRKGNESEDIAEKLADKYGGQFDLLTNEDDSFAVFDCIRNGELVNYGTVMLITHCGYVHRDDDSCYITPTIYSDKDEDVANAAYDILRNRIPQSERNCLVYSADSNQDYSQARMLFNVNYRYFDNINEFIHLDTYYDIMITSNYIMDVYSDAWFENTVFYLGACHSYEDEVFNQFLIDHGASCVIGYNASIQVNCEQTICKSIFSDMMKTNNETITDISARNYSVVEARDRGYNVVMQVFAGYSSLLGGTVDASLQGMLSFVCEGYGKVSGMVSDKKDVPLSGITVTAYRYWNGSLRREKSVSTNSDGRYTFDGLPWGMYLIQAHDQDTEEFRQLSFAVEERTNINFVLNRAQLNVTVTNKDGEFLPASVSCVSDSGMVYHLELNIEDFGYPVFSRILNSGTYRISVTCEGYEGCTETVILESGETSRSYTLEKLTEKNNGMTYNGHFYRVYAVKASWESAKIFCESLGGHLVTITDAGEQNAVFNYIQEVAPDTDLWIGFSDAADETNWSTWITGELVTYSNWSPDEPDNMNGQDYGVICNGERKGTGYYIAPGQWDDISSTDSTNLGYFICEWDYEITG